MDSEVLVVCSGCSDDTVKIVQEYARKDSRLNIHIENERHGKASAMNHILANAKGDAILFISADTLPQGKCFTMLTSKLKDPKVGLVCGHPVPVNNTKSLPDILVNVLWRSHDYVFQHLSDDGVAKHASEVFCIRSGIVKEIPVDIINDDAFLALAVVKCGWRVVYDSRSSVLICGPKTFPDYLKQRRRILIGHWQIKKSTGESPQHLAYLLPVYPKKVLKLLFGLCKEYGLPTFAAFAAIEMMINLSTVPSLIGNKPIHNHWSTACSTKEVIKQDASPKKGLAHRNLINES